jgi:hypothetical protein
LILPCIIYWQAKKINCIINEYGDELDCFYQAQYCRGESVRKLLGAYHLENNEHSQRIVENITKGQGLLSIIANSSDFPDWVAGKSLIIEWVTLEKYNSIDIEMSEHIADKVKPFWDVRHAESLSSASAFSEEKNYGYSFFSKL